MEQIQIFLFVLVYTMPGAAGTLIVLPQNCVVMRGQEATMVCQTDKTEIELLFERELPASQKEGEKIVFTGYQISRYVAHFCKLMPSLQNGEYNIRINSIEEAAQRYTCTEPGTLDSGSAELIVLNSHAICVDDSNNDYINASCTILFNGNWPPEMTWTLNGEDVLETLTTKVLQLNESLTSRLVLQRNLTGYSMSCKTNFTNRLKPIVTTAKNVPTYTSTWQTTASAPVAPTVTTEDHNVKIIAAISFSLTFLLLSAIGIFIFIYRRYMKSARKGNANTGQETLMQVVVNNPNDSKREEFLDTKKPDQTDRQ